MKYLSGGIIAIILLIGAYIGGYYHGSQKEPIKVTEEKVEPTIWTQPQLKQKIEKKELTPEDTLVVNDCFIRPILITSNTEGNYLYIVASDTCKTTKARYTIRARDINYWIIQPEVDYIYKIGFLYGMNFLYNFNIIAFGGGIIGNENNIGCKIIAQIKI